MISDCWLATVTALFCGTAVLRKDFNASVSRQWEDVDVHVIADAATQVMAETMTLDQRTVASATSLGTVQEFTFELQGCSLFKFSQQGAIGETRFHSALVSHRGRLQAAAAPGLRPDVTLMLRGRALAERDLPYAAQGVVLAPSRNRPAEASGVLASASLRASRTCSGRSLVQKPLGALSP